MNKMKEIALYSSIALMMFGCSGHTLQTLTDKAFDQKTQAQPSKAQTPSQNSALLSVSPTPTENIPQKTVAPSQNQALYTVSPSNQKKPDGAMQKSMDKWVKKEWTPIVDKNATIKARDENESRAFKLQDYVDKATYYIKHEPKSDQPSNVEKLSKLPVIGE
jgi:hypothetical protein